MREIRTIADAQDVLERAGYKSSLDVYTSKDGRHEMIGFADPYTLEGRAIQFMLDNARQPEPNGHTPGIQVTRRQTSSRGFGLIGRKSDQTTTSISGRVTLTREGPDGTKETIIAEGDAANRLADSFAARLGRGNGQDQLRNGEGPRRLPPPGLNQE